MTHREHPTDAVPATTDDNAPLPPARRGISWTVRRGRSIAFVLVGLAVAVSLVSVYATYQAAQESAAQAAAVDHRLSVLEEDLAERTRQRDQERDANAARDAEFSAYLCSVLSQLPGASPNLEQLRRALGCQEPGTTTPPPGPPPAPGPPAAAPSSSTTAPPSSTVGPTPPAAHQATPKQPASPPPADPAPPPPPREPADRGPVRDLICALPLFC